MGVGQGNHVVDVQVSCFCYNGYCVRSEPLAPIHGAPATISEAHGHCIFIDQDLGPGVLTIAVSVDPVLPVAPVIQR